MAALSGAAATAGGSSLSQISDGATLLSISITLTVRALATLPPTVYPRLFEISITLTFRAGYHKRVIDTATVYSRVGLNFPPLPHSWSRDGRLPTLV